MLSRRFVIAACFSLAAAPGALAQSLSGGPGAPPLPGGPPPIPDAFPPPPPGMAPRPPRPPQAPNYDGISEREAVRIARRRGIVDVERVRRSRDGWIVAGTDDYGDSIRVIVSDDGDVLDVRRD